MDWDVAAVTYEKSKVHAGGDCHALSFSTKTYYYGKEIRMEDTEQIIQEIVQYLYFMADAKKLRSILAFVKGLL